MNKMTMMAVLVTTLWGAGAMAHGWGNNGPKCPAYLYFRTPEQVMQDHRQALADKDWEAVACNYSKQARVISDQGVTIGRDNIVADLQALDALFGTTPTVVEETISADVVRVLFELDLGFAVIPDGVDTYVIWFGQIHRQTAHGNLVFLGPPPGP